MTSSAFDFSAVPDQYRAAVETAVQQWADSGTPYGPRRRGQQDFGESMFAPRKYIVGTDPYEQMRVAAEAVAHDDVVGGLADVTEGLIFQGLKFESSDPDSTDVFNQLAADLDLDGFVRMLYRELFTYSQAIIASVWHTKTYRPRRKGASGRRTRKAYTIQCPQRLFLLDPRKVVPVTGVLGELTLYWSASDAELSRWSRDPVLSEVCLGRYSGDGRDLPQGVDGDRLLRLNPSRVWRHAATTQNYRAFPDVRMAAVFRLLDLKSQLMDADRAALVGNSRFIVLVRKGTDSKPASPQEIRKLHENVNTLAKLPVIVGDHRLDVSIVAPRMDTTLVSEKYDTLDRRILSRVLGALTTSSSGQRNESTLTVARMVGRLLESRRHMIKRSLELHIVKAIDELNPGTFDRTPSLAYFPAKVALDSDSEFIAALTTARQQRDLSRESWLEALGYSQDVEAMRRNNEEESGLDAIFRTTMPYDSPENNDRADGVPSAHAE